MFETTIAGSLPKPFWLADPEKLWPEWRSRGADLAAAKRDATLLWLKAQEDAPHAGWHTHGHQAQFAAHGDG